MTDRERIEAGEWVPCRICEAVFRRKKETARFCARCDNGACEGEHGSFAYNRFTCIICGAPRDYKTRYRATEAETSE